MNNYRIPHRFDDMEKQFVGCKNETSDKLNSGTSNAFGAARLARRRLTVVVRGRRLRITPGTRDIRHFKYTAARSVANRNEHCAPCKLEDP